MSSGSKLDPCKTYVLEETSITRVNSIEELAELAMRQISGSSDEYPNDGDAEKASKPDRSFGPDDGRED